MHFNWKIDARRIDSCVQVFSLPFNRKIDPWLVMPEDKRDP